MSSRSQLRRMKWRERHGRAAKQAEEIEKRAAEAERSRAEFAARMKREADVAAFKTEVARAHDAISRALGVPPPPPAPPPVPRPASSWPHRRRLWGLSIGSLAILGLSLPTEK